MVVLDIIFLPVSVWLSFWLRLAQPFSHTFLTVGLWIIPSVLIIGIPLYYYTAQYKGLTRYVGSISLYFLAARNALLVLILATIGFAFQLPLPPRSSWFLLWLLLTGFTGTIRFGLRDLFINLRSIQHKPRTTVAIYGAGEAGALLLSALRSAGNHKVVAFLDDNPHFWSRTINGIPIYPPHVLNSSDYSVDQVMLAIPALTRSERRRIVSGLQNQGIPVLQVPSIDDLTSGRAKIDSLRPVAIEDLLGRDPISVNSSLIRTSIASSVVCVTGAGGSIGSELCRQIVDLHPSRLIIIDHSEPSLYSIEQELLSLVPDGVVIQPVLGSASDSLLIRNVFAQVKVDFVFHAAAYKHVPLVEANPLVGIANNVFSTQVICSASSESGVKKVILISSDKAVRPTNVMGASKRLSELIVQASAINSTSTCFAMVRFGNVLGSSGSVVPLFHRQIEAGGPITLTHPEIIRFFMTIPEAAQLVLQASAFADGGEVFLLDMGEPVRIKSLAEQMVRLSGLSVRNSNNPSGEIEIICTGLRPGEKLYEELLIDAESQPTAHPLIYRAQESSVAPHILSSQLDSLKKAISSQDIPTAFSILEFLVPEWKRS